MEMILKKGVHTFNEWTLAIDRWVEDPPADYLQFIPVWIQIRNISVNHYTVPTITMLGEFVGQVIEVAFDPAKSQVTEYVRVRVKFDVSKPVRRSKKINFKEGQVNILYDFERIQKRCFYCQRLTHEQEVCPIRAKDIQEKKLATKLKGKESGFSKEKIIKESDPLFGVIEDSQVGVDPSTGRERIAKEVVDGMRQYMLVAKGDERLIREERIKKSLCDLSNDPLGQKTILRLEPYPLVSSDINKEKGVVFGYQMEKDSGQLTVGDDRPAELGSIAGCSSSSRSTEREILNSGLVSSFSNESPTVFKAGLSGIGLSPGSLLKNGKTRKRPFKSRRKRRSSANATSQPEITIGTIQQVPFLVGVEGGGKRKATDEAQVPSKVAKCINQLVVPNEGPSNS